LLAGCDGESLTAPPMGANALTGQVCTTGDLTGASPADISVTCSGLVSVTDSRGCFAFASVSATSMRLTNLSTGSLYLFFSRKDGINASGSVSPGTSSVLVYLQKTEANIVATGQSKRELEGPITAISSSSITVNDASTGGPVTAAITSSTVIRQGNHAQTTTELKLSDCIHVTATVSVEEPPS